MTAIEYRWIPDPAEFARRADAVALAFDDMTPPLAAASEEIRMAIKQRFETERDPQGVQWPSLSLSYQAASGKAARGQILKTTHELEDAATSAEAMVISENTVFYRTDILPHYGLAHETGLSERGGGYGGSSGALPQRAFLGISEEDAAKIEALFFEWSERNIDLWVTPLGNIGTRHAIHGAGGRFIARSEVGLGPIPQV